MSPEYEIKKDIVLRFLKNRDESYILPSEEEDIIDNVILRLEEDEKSGFSFSEQSQEWRDSYYDETDITADWSRHYESKFVAKELLNGKWVGYTYWHGGGKYGEPQAIPWMDKACFLGYEEKIITKKYFHQLHENVL